MYCFICDEKVENDDLIKDEDGYEHGYDVQVCIKCSPKRIFTEQELDEFIYKINNE